MASKRWPILKCATMHSFPVFTIQYLSCLFCQLLLCRRGYNPSVFNPPLSPDVSLVVKGKESTAVWAFFHSTNICWVPTMRCFWGGQGWWSQVRFLTLQCSPPSKGDTQLANKLCKFWWGLWTMKKIKQKKGKRAIHSGVRAGRTWVVKVRFQSTAVQGK